MLYSDPRRLLLNEQHPNQIPITSRKDNQHPPTRFIQTMSCPAFSAIAGGKLAIGFVFALALNVDRMSSVLFAFHAS